MGASLLFTTPIDAPGRHHGKKVTPPWPPAGTPPRNFQKNSRPPAGNSLDRTPPGLHPGKNAPAFGRGRLVVSEYAGKIDFCMRK